MIKNKSISGWNQKFFAMQAGLVFNDRIDIGYLAWRPRQMWAVSTDGFASNWIIFEQGGRYACVSSLIDPRIKSTPDTLPVCKSFGSSLAVLVETCGQPGLGLHIELTDYFTKGKTLTGLGVPTNFHQIPQTLGNDLIPMKRRSKLAFYNSFDERGAGTGSTTKWLFQGAELPK